MKTRRALIISGHPLFAEAITRQLQEEKIQVVVTANSLESALALLEASEVEAIIVDHDDSQLRDVEVDSRLIGHHEEQRVIFLTLPGNQMIVHHRELAENVTAADLVQAIQQ